MTYCVTELTEFGRPSEMILRCDTRLGESFGCVVLPYRILVYASAPELAEKNGFGEDNSCVEKGDTEKGN